MSEQRTFKVPAAKLADVKALQTRIHELVEEKLALDRSYMASVARINSDIIDLKRKSIHDMCAAVGVTYDDNNAHMIDTSYLNEHGVAYFTVVDADGDDQTSLLRDTALPVGGKSN